MLYYEGHATGSILHDASESDVESALAIMPVVRGVNVDFSLPSSGACNSTAINVMQVGQLTSSLIALRS